MADGADAGAMSLGLDLKRERAARRAINVGDKAELDEIVGAEGAAQLGEEGRREPVFADLDDGIEFLTEGAELGFLRAGEREVIHVS